MIINRTVKKATKNEKPLFQELSMYTMKKGLKKNNILYNFFF